MYKKIAMISGLCIVLITGCGQQDKHQTVSEINSEISQTEKEEEQKEESEKVEKKIESDYTGILLEDNKIFYYRNGYIDITYTGLAEYDNQWWYIKNGVVDYDYTGVAYKNDGLWYISNGVIDTAYTGAADFWGNSLSVKNGYIDSTFFVPKPDETVINVPKSEVNVVFENSDDIYETHYTDQTNPNTDEYEFTSGDRGLYRVIAKHRVEDSSGYELSQTWLNFEFRILDKYRNELGKHAGKLKNLGCDVGTRSIFFNAGDKYIFSDETTRFTNLEDKYIGRRDITVLFLKPYIDISSLAGNQYVWYGQNEAQKLLNSLRKSWGIIKNDNNDAYFIFLLQCYLRYKISLDSIDDINQKSFLLADIVNTLSDAQEKADEKALDEFIENINEELTEKIDSDDFDKLFSI